MNWTVEWKDNHFPPLYAAELRYICQGMRDAIEDWLEEFVESEPEDELAPWCEYCNANRGTHWVTAYEVCRTDRGMERGEIEYWMCHRCDPRSAP